MTTLVRHLSAPEPGWTTSADVVVVGSGIAGLTAALRLRRKVPKVLLVTKTVLSSGSTLWAQGGIAAALADTDSPQAHLSDTLVAGVGLCDEAAVRALVTEGPARIHDLIDLGAHFDTDEVGEVKLTREGGHHADRIVHAGGDATGAEVSRALIAALEEVRNDRGIEVIEHALVLDLLTAAPDQDGRPGPVCGVSLHVIGEGSIDGVGAALAPAVVLATGGIGQVFSATTNPKEATGDGSAAALRAGAALADLEFVQFHPTVLYLGAGARGQLPLISEAVRGEGAHLVDTSGTRFMLGQHELAELAPRDVVSKAIVRQMALTGDEHVFLDARHLGTAFINRRFPTIQGALALHGYSLAEDLVPVAPAQHYHSGGVRVDLLGRSSLPGLYAVGETSCTGVHGANRLASNSLLEGLVFARRIADDIPARLSAGELVPHEPVARSGPPGLVNGSRRGHIQEIGTAGPGVIRTADGLARAADDLERISQSSRKEPATWEWETTNLHQVSTALTAVAALREETRGGHYREDFPERDDEHWRVRLVTSLTPDGALEVSRESVGD
ncbi:MAG: L-aspartate oxidase [Actinomycetales bacterium]